MTEYLVCQKRQKMQITKSVDGHCRIDFGPKITGRWSRWTGGRYTQGHYTVKRLGNPKTGSYRQVVAIDRWSLRQV